MHAQHLGGGLLDGITLTDEMPRLMVMAGASGAMGRAVEVWAVS
jgi:hypothetical protein